MEAGTKDSWWGWLVTLMLLALIGFAWYCLSTGKTLEGVSIVVGVLISKVGTMIDFRYGSSKGSADKTQMIAKKTNDNENAG